MVAACPAEASQADIADAFAAGEGAAMARAARFLDTLSARVAAGRSTTNPHSYDPETLSWAAALISGAASSIRAGLAEPDGAASEGPCA